MEPSFWTERWHSGQIGFHERAPNRFLSRYLTRLGAPGRVFVPLCGKAVDLDVLAAAGFDVVGSELVPLAVEQYFRERGVSPVTRATPSGVAHEGAGLTLVVGDVFAFELEGAPFDAAYDRAALVALEPSKRARYAAKLASLVRPGAPMLLVTFDHDAPGGPPHSVPRAEVNQLFDAAFEVELLSSENALLDGRFAARGASRATEEAYLLTRR